MQLGDVVLPLVQSIILDGQQIVTQQAVPGLAGDLLQTAGRHAWELTVRGVLAGDGTDAAFKVLRAAFRAGQPLPLIANSTPRIYDVLITGLDTRRVAGRPEYVEYQLILREYTPPPPDDTFEPPLPHTPLSMTGTLLFPPGLTITLQGHDLTRQTNKAVYHLPGGDYRVTAYAPSGQCGHTTITAYPGETSHVDIPLQPLPPITAVFTLHFDLNSAFVAPPMRHVLGQVLAHAWAHPDQQLVIRGHADLSEDDPQAISEARAQNALVFLMGDGKPVERWRIRQVQQVLYDLGYYDAAFNEDGNLATYAALRDFQETNGLPVNGLLTDATRAALATTYLNTFHLKENQFSGADTLAVSVRQLVRNTEAAWRPNRRVDLFFTIGDVDAATVDLSCFVQSRLIPVQGMIRFADGRPFSGARFVLTAPTGEYLHGEFPTGLERGQPVAGRADAEGRFAFAHWQPAGVFVFELREPDGAFITTRRLDERNSLLEIIV